MALLTPTSTKEEVYSDFLNDLTLHPIRKDVSRNLNEESVKRAIKNILLTNYYERPFRPKFGANITKYLFEPLTPITLSLIRSDIVNAITNYEPRANIIDVTVSADNTDDNSISVTVVFSVINNSNPVTLITTLALDRVR